MPNEVERKATQKKPAWRRNKKDMISTSAGGRRIRRVKKSMKRWQIAFRSSERGIQRDSFHEERHVAKKVSPRDAPISRGARSGYAL